MNNNDKKKFKKNIFQLILGLILLGFSFVYLANHKAETKSIFSGFETLFEKIAVSRERISSDNNANLLEKKFKIEKYLDDILGTLATKNCISSKEFKRIETIKKDLVDMKISDLQSRLDEYFEEVFIIDNIVKQSCLKNQ